MKKKDWIALVAWVVLSEVAGIVGSLFTASSIPTWYVSLVRPALAPPNWVFGPVWTTLFLLMGVAAFLVWRVGAHHKAVKLALVIFFIQLGLNVLWSIIFFGLQNPSAALVEIIFLELAILATIVTFARVSRPAALLLLPYIVWVSFASYLNYMISILN